MYIIYLKRRVFRIYKEFLQLNNEKSKELIRHFSEEDIQMVKEYVKSCPTLLIIKELQIETTK